MVSVPPEWPTDTSRKELKSTIGIKEDGGVECC